jgi:hypothetical protein
MVARPCISAGSPDPQEKKLATVKEAKSQTENTEGLK